MTIMSLSGVSEDNYFGTFCYSINFCDSICLSVIVSNEGWESNFIFFTLKSF